MKNVSNLKSVALADFVDAPERLRELRARDHAVLHIVARRNPAHRAEGVLAPFPQQLALAIVARHAHLARLVRLAHLAHRCRLRLGRFAQPFQLDQKHGRAVQGETGVDVRLDGAQRPAVEHFARRRSDPARGDVRHGFRGVIHRVIYCQQGFHRFGLAQQLHRDFGHQRQRALRAHQQSGQVVARRVERFSADTHDFAIRQHQLEAQHVICRHAIRQRVRPARVFRHVAADRAGLLARRIGRVVEIGVLDSARQFVIHHAGLHHSALVFEIDGQDAIHPRKHDLDAAAQRQRAAGKPRSCAARHNRHAALMGNSRHCGHITGGSHEHDAFRARLFRRAVIFVEQQVFGFRENVCRAQRLL